MADIKEKDASGQVPEEKEYRELTDDEIEDIAGGCDFQVHRFRYYDGPAGGESEQKPTVFEPVR